MCLAAIGAKEISAVEMRLRWPWLTLLLLYCMRLQARNIMLKSTGGSGRGVTAKVADFGLAVKMDHMETHLSNAFQVSAHHNIIGRCMRWHG